jgi:Tfp pilus assembly protein PilN
MCQAISRRKTVGRAWRLLPRRSNLLLVQQQQRRCLLRDVEFLPSWYSQLRRRKRALLVQSIATGVIVVALTGVTFANRLDVEWQQAIATGFAAEAARCGPALTSLERLRTQQRQLRQQEQVITDLGQELDPTRLLNVVEDTMPPAVALTDLSMEPVAASDRALSIRLQGVATSDADVATLLTNLGNVRFFDDVTMSYSRDHVGGTSTGAGAQATREFEVTFSLNQAGRRQ